MVSVKQMLLSKYFDYVVLFVVIFAAIMWSMLLLFAAMCLIVVLNVPARWILDGIFKLLGF